MGSPAWLPLLVLGQTPFLAARPDGVYAPDWLTPDQILEPNELAGVQTSTYVTVRGMAVYYSHPADGDHHFSILASNHVSPGRAVSKETLHQFGLTCEIKPAITLGNLTEIRKLRRTSPGTYRFVEVKGFLRFGTEGASGHDAVRTFTHEGRAITGHWEIHPVELVRSLDSKPEFASGPAANFEDPLGGTMAVLESWADYPKISKQNNHVRLRARVTQIRLAADGSGDYELKLVATSGSSPRPSTWASVPPYFVESYDPAAHTLRFKPGTVAVGDSEVRVNQNRKFFGLRTWVFEAGKAYVPRLRPVMRIEPLN